MPESRADYKGDFDPSLVLEDFEHSLLACYARDIMLANHIHDRSALLQVLMKYGMQAQTEVACDEWMGSSPIYNARNRELLNISGDDAAEKLARKPDARDAVDAPGNYAFRPPGPRVLRRGPEPHRGCAPPAAVAALPWPAHPGKPGAPVPLKTARL
jgi:hypothetical protein